MEMDCNLKKVGNFLLCILCILEKSLKTDHSLFLLGEITSYFPPGALRAISYREEVLIEIFKNCFD